MRDGVLFPKGLRQSAEQAASSDLAVSPISVEIENRSVKGATCLECAAEDEKPKLNEAVGKLHGSGRRPLGKR